MDLLVVEVINAFLAGVLAGAEFLVRYGLRAPLAGLDQRPHLQLRRALVLRLRVLVPAILLPAIASGAAVVVLGRTLPGFTFRFAGPDNWREMIARWEALNTVRCWAFAFFLIAVASQLPVGR